MSQRGQVLYPDAYEDDEIILPGKKQPDPNAEWRLQAAAIKLVRAAMRKTKDLRFIAPGAEGMRYPNQAAIAKMMGRLEPGVADLILIQRGPWRIHMIWIEFKRPGGKLSQAQKDWFLWLYPAGVKCYRCDNLDSFKQILDEFTF